MLTQGDALIAKIDLCYFQRQMGFPTRVVDSMVKLSSKGGWSPSGAMSTCMGSIGFWMNKKKIPCTQLHYKLKQKGIV